MSFYYSAYGLRISADLPIRALSESTTSNALDLEIWLGSEPPWLCEFADSPSTFWYTSPDEDDPGRPALTAVKLAGGSYFRLSYGDGTTFVVDRLGSRIWATWSGASTVEDTITYLLGPVLGFVLRLRGITCLHASAVAVGEQAIALAGPAGAGKSTTAAVFAQRGYRVLSDDVTPLLARRDFFLVWPGYPRVCLWPDSVASLYGSAEALPRLTPNWEKRYLPLDDNGCRFQPKALPLAAIYLLDERSAASSAPLVEPVPAGADLMALVTNTYMNYLLDREQRAREFELLGRLLARVALRRVKPHQNPIHLARLCEVIVDDFQAQHTGAAVANQVRSA